REGRLLVGVARLEGDLRREGQEQGRRLAQVVAVDDEGGRRPDLQAAQVDGEQVRLGRGQRVGGADQDEEQEGRAEGVHRDSVTFGERGASAPGGRRRWTAGG